MQENLHVVADIGAILAGTTSPGRWEAHAPYNERLRPIPARRHPPARPRAVPPRLRSFPRRARPGLRAGHHAGLDYCHTDGLLVGASASRRLRDRRAITAGLELARFEPRW